MKRASVLGLLLVLVLSVGVYGQGTDLANELQDLSVTIKSPNKYGGEGQGSGVFVTRELPLKKGDKEKVKVNFIWTAAHVIDNLREVRTVIDPKTGTKRDVVEFRDAQIVQELRDNGRRVGEINMDAKVVRYSDADYGEDLALLMVRKRGFVNVNAEFYLEEEIPPVGIQLFHVGSLLGQLGANSLTTGVISQHGRVLQLSRGDGTVFDQTTATAFPGSSGGGVFLSGQHSDEKWTAHKGKYIGMLVRGAGENFNLIVPIRRMKEWAKSVDAEWAVDPSVEAPSLEEILEHKVEDVGVEFNTSTSSKSIDSYRFPTLDIKRKAKYDSPSEEVMDIIIENLKP